MAIDVETKSVLLDIVKMIHKQAAWTAVVAHQSRVYLKIHAKHGEEELKREDEAMYEELFETTKTLIDRIAKLKE